LDIDILVPDVTLSVASLSTTPERLCTALNLGYVQREWHTSAAIQGIADFFPSADCIFSENFLCLIFPRDSMSWRSSSSVHIISFFFSAVNNLPLKQDILLFPAPPVCVTLFCRRVISELKYTT